MVFLQCLPCSLMCSYLLITLFFPKQEYTPHGYPATIQTHLIEISWLSSHHFHLFSLWPPRHQDHTSNSHMAIQPPLTNLSNPWPSSHHCTQATPMATQPPLKNTSLKQKVSWLSSHHFHFLSPWLSSHHFHFLSPWLSSHHFHFVSPWLSSHHHKLPAFFPYIVSPASCICHAVFKNWLTAAVICSYLQYCITHDSPWYFARSLSRFFLPFFLFPLHSAFMQPLHPGALSMWFLFT